MRIEYRFNIDQVEIPCFSVETTEGALRITVADDGRGFDLAAPTTGFGLMGMRERIDLAGGSVSIGPNDPGTRVDVVLPVQTRP